MQNLLKILSEEMGIEKREFHIFRSSPKFKDNGFGFLIAMAWLKNPPDELHYMLKLLQVTFTRWGRGEIGFGEFCQIIGNAKREWDKKGMKDFVYIERDGKVTFKSN